MKLELAARVARGTGFTLDVGLSCEADALGIVGPSGSGKSTLLAAIAGFEPARVVVDGRDLSALPPERREVGYVAQEPLLFPHLTVRENLEYGPRAGDAREAAEALGIAALLERRPRTLSGGERRRAALARAIASRPRLLLLDEPFTALDEPRRREAMALVDFVRRRFALPMVLVSHRAEEVVGLTERAARLEAGRIVETGPSAAVLRAGEGRIDSVFDADVVGPGRVRCGAVELAVELPEGAAGRVRLAVYATDVIFATEMPRGISARNRLWTEIAAVEPAGPSVLVTLAEPRIRAVVTREAAEALGIRAGARLVAIIKATSLAVISPC